MNKREETFVLKCIEALSTVATFNCEFGHGRKAVSAIAEHAENFLEIGLWYARKKLANAVITMYKKAIDVCYNERDLEFEYGRRVLRKSIRTMLKMLQDE